MPQIPVGTALDSIHRKLWLSSVENTKASHTPKRDLGWEEHTHLVLSAWWQQLPALTAARRTPGPHAQVFHFEMFQTFRHLANLQAGQVTGTVPDARPGSPRLPCENLIPSFMESGINH